MDSNYCLLMNVKGLILEISFGYEHINSTLDILSVFLYLLLMNKLKMHQF